MEEMGPANTLQIMKTSDIGLERFSDAISASGQTRMQKKQAPLGPVSTVSPKE